MKHYQDQQCEGQRLSFELFFVHSDDKYNNLSVWKQRETRAVHSAGMMHSLDGS